MAGPSHFDDEGNARMADVSGKASTVRTATARGRVLVSADTMARIRDGTLGKGDVLAVARVAGIQAAKRTPDLIPLCHPLPLDAVAVDLSLDPADNAVDVAATCRLHGRTGVEMEALTAVGVAALTVYDMCKSADRTIRITDIRLVAKSGGRSGGFRAE